MIKAVIFDFDGVIADTEPVHFHAFKNVMSEYGFNLSVEEYYDRYLAYDDKTFFNQYFNDHGRIINHEELILLLKAKSATYDNLIKDKIKLFPGVDSFLNKIYNKYRIAIGSGALKNEILQALDVLQIGKYFELIVSAEDVEKCKPDPEVYLRVLSEINSGSQNLLTPEQCIVIEDSVHGIEAAKSAGMKCIAVTNSYSAVYLKKADVILDSLDELTLNMF